MCGHRSDLRFHPFVLVRATRLATAQDPCPRAPPGAGASEPAAGPAATLTGTTDEPTGDPVRRPAWPTRAILATLLALGTAGLAGCTSRTPITAEEYAASDGVDLTLGSLDAGNLLVLAAELDAPGTVLGSLTNTGDADLLVSIGLADAQIEIALPAGTTALLGPDQTPVDLASVPAPPGALVELTVATDADGATSLQVPVLDGTLEAYADLVPQP